MKTRETLTFTRTQSGNNWACDHFDALLCTASVSGYFPETATAKRIEIEFRNEYIANAEAKGWTSLRQVNDADWFDVQVGTSACVEMVDSLEHFLQELAPDQDTIYVAVWVVE